MLLCENIYDRKCTLILTKMFLFQKTEKTEFLSFFYKHCMHVLSAPLLANTTEEKPSKGTEEFLRNVASPFIFCTCQTDGSLFMVITAFTLHFPLDDFQTCQLLALILELLTFCVEHHTYHIKNYIINKDILRRVLVLTASQHAFLALCKSQPVFFFAFHSFSVLTKKSSSCCLN